VLPRTPQCVAAVPQTNTPTPACIASPAATSTLPWPVQAPPTLCPSPLPAATNAPPRRKPQTARASLAPHHADTLPPTAPHERHPTLYVPLPAGADGHTMISLFSPLSADQSKPYQHTKEDHENSLHGYASHLVTSSCPATRISVFFFVISLFFDLELCRIYCVPHPLPRHPTVPHRGGFTVDDMPRRLATPTQGHVTMTLWPPHRHGERPTLAVATSPRRVAL
jgi:hypothetical protein